MRRIRCSVLLIWLVSLVLTGILASAQTRREAGTVISGDDIGFRPEGWNGKARTGTWVVRINGQWVDAQGSIKAVPVTR